MKLSESIKVKIRSYAKHSAKANEIRKEIDSWFEFNGTSLDEDFCTLDGGVINDILIDTSIHGSPEEAIELIEKQLG